MKNDSDNLSLHYWFQLFKIYILPLLSSASAEAL